MERIHDSGSGGFVKESASTSSPRPVRGWESALSGAFSLIGEKLIRVEETVNANLRSDIAPVDEAGQYIAESAGKRIRPALLLFCSGLLDYRGEHDVLLGAVYEFIHTATLVHDDIIDEAEVRRGRPTVNRIFGNDQTVLVGDYLYIRAVSMALEPRKLRIMDVLTETTQRMIEGEIMAHHLRGRAGVSSEEHLSIIERKTAALFEGCCRTAAILAGASTAAEERLAVFGVNLGIAFQLVDDLLDLTADEKTLGKPVASDLREGRLTHPWIDLMASGTEQDRTDIRNVLEDQDFERVAFERLRARLENVGSLERTRRLAMEHATRAREAIETFPEGVYRSALLDVTRFVLSRDR